MDTLPTPRLYRDLHRVDAICGTCGRVVRLDLAGLINAGFGDMPLIRLPLKCSVCGKRGHKVIVSGKAQSGR